MAKRTFSVLHSTKLKDAVYGSKTSVAAASRVFNDLCKSKKTMCDRFIRLIDNHDRVFKYRIKRILANKVVTGKGNVVAKKFALKKSRKRYA